MRFDFRDVYKALDKTRDEVRDKMVRAGQRFVETARKEGDYQDRTGNLRASNYYRIHGDTLEVGNSAPYASNVEQRGYKVCSDAFLEIRREFE